MLKMCTKYYFLQLLALVLVKNAQLLSILPHCIDAPEGCPSDLIGFYLYNANYVDGLQLYLGNSTSITGASFESGSPIKFIIHGYDGGRNTPRMQELRKAYFQVGSYNVIYLDWKELSKGGCYYNAFKSVPAIGKCGAEFIKSLLKLRSDVHIKDIHVIGFSLGAQAAARLSNDLMESNIFLERLTALEAALPLFFPLVVMPKNIVSRRHAKFVDAYHTNAGIFGVETSNAHIDVYANGGTFQPGCGIEDVICSHGRAVDYYTESIVDKMNGFYAVKCSEEYEKSTHKILVGEYCNPVLPQDRGCWRFETNSEPPFAKGPNPNQ